MTRAVTDRLLRAPRRSTWFRLAGAAAIVVLYCFLARDGRHHWHEWRHLYSAANYSVADLVHGQFDPGPPPERSAEEVGAWYWGQIGHEGLLRAGVKTLGRGLGTATSLLWLYGAAMLLTAVLLFATCRRLPLGLPAALIAVVFLFSPLGVYLGFKLMGEVPALLSGTLACFLLVKSLNVDDRRRAAATLVACSAALALSFLFKVFLPLYFLGFVAALAVAFPETFALRRVVTRSALVVAGAAVLAAGLGVFVSVGPGDWPRIHGFFRGFRQPPAASLFGLLTAGSLLYLVVPFALLALPTRPKALVFFGTWLAASTLPGIALATNFVESRYVVVGLGGFAGLVVLAFVAIAERLHTAWRSTRSTAIAWLGAGVFVVSVAVGTQPFMPYEMDSDELVAAVERVWGGDADAAILLPWNYTDYHFLAFAFPDRPVYLVQSAVDERGRPYRDIAWERRMRATYGSAFMADFSELERLRGKLKVYLGHGILPPFSNLAAVAEVIGARWIVGRLEAMQPRVHVSESWMWTDPRIRLDPAFQLGQYRVFRVQVRREAPTGSAGGAAGDPSASAGEGRVPPSGLARAYRRLGHASASRTAQSDGDASG